MKNYPIIHIRDLNKTYKGETPLHVLKGINLDIEEGELLCIQGVSGSGKSTLLNIIGLLDSYDTGEFYLADNLIHTFSRSRITKLRNQYLGYIFQSFNLIDYKNALQNVALPLYYRGIGRSKREKLSMEYLSKVGLENFWNHTPKQLSGGQKQRVAIARALVTNPKILLADEPTGALDSATSQDVMNLLINLNREYNQTIIIVSHDHNIARQANRSIYITDGLIDVSNHD